MKVSELIERLQELAKETGGDPEVVAQTSGCCNHGHEIRKAEWDTLDFEPLTAIVLRCS